MGRWPERVKDGESGEDEESDQMMRTAEEWLEFIAAQPDHIVSEAEIFLGADEIEKWRVSAPILHEMVESGSIVYVPVLAGTSGDGSCCLPDCPRLPQLVKLHAEWNAKHPAQAEKWPQAKAFGERYRYE